MPREAFGRTKPALFEVSGPQDFSNHVTTGNYKYICLRSKTLKS